MNIGSPAETWRAISTMGGIHCVKLSFVRKNHGRQISKTTQISAATAAPAAASRSGDWFAPGELLSAAVVIFSSCDLPHGNLAGSTQRRCGIRGGGLELEQTKGSFQQGDRRASLVIAAIR